MTANARVYVGCYTAARSGRDGAPGGIVVLDMDENGELAEVAKTVEGMEVDFVSLSPDGRHLYAVDERKNDGKGPVGPAASIHSFELMAAGAEPLRKISGQPTLGAYPTYISIDAAGEFLVLASHGSYEHVQRVVQTNQGWAIDYVYDDSTVSLFRVDRDGQISDLCDLHVTQGHGPDPCTTPQAGHHGQASSHAHSARFDPSSNYVIVCDKGADQIHVYRLDRDQTRLELQSTWVAPSSTGPRHPVFHSRLPFMFVTDEISSRVSTYRFDDTTGTLTHIASVVSTSPGFSGYNEPADVQVHPSGRFVFAVNRGDDSVVSFSLNEASGELSFADSVPVSKSPHPGLAARSICPDESGRFLLVADMPGDRVLTYEIDETSGKLNLIASVTVPQPVYVVSAPAIG